MSKEARRWTNKQKSRKVVKVSRSNRFIPAAPRLSFFAAEEIVWRTLLARPGDLTLIGSCKEEKRDENNPKRAATPPTGSAEDLLIRLIFTSQCHRKWLQYSNKTQTHSVCACVWKEGSVERRGQAPANFYVNQVSGIGSTSASFCSRVSILCVFHPSGPTYSCQFDSCN